MYTLLLQSVPWAGSKRLEIIATVLLIAMTIFAVSVITSGFLRIRKAQRASTLYAPEVAWALRESNWKSALEISEHYSKESHLAALVLAALRSREEDKDRFTESLLFKCMEQAMQVEIMRLEDIHKDYLGIVQAIGASAPVIGSIGGTAITISFAIVFAIPAVWFSYYLRKKNGHLEIEAKNTAKEFMFFMENRSTSESRSTARVNDFETPTI